MLLTASTATASATPLHAADTGPAPAAPAAPDTAVHVTLQGQDAWTAAGGTLTLKVRVTPASAVTPGSTLVISGHQSVTRANFQRTLDGGEALGSPLDQVTVPFGTLPADVSGDRVVTVGLQDQKVARDQSRLLLRAASGVYPLDVELRDDDNRPVDHFVTFAVIVAPGANGRPPIASKLQVAWVWPLAAPPAFRLDGSPDPKVVAQLRPGGRLGRQVVALRQSTGVPVTLVPSPETVESWATLGQRDPALQGGVEALRTLRPEDQVLSGPYVPIDMGSLLDHNLGGAVDAELTPRRRSAEVVLRHTRRHHDRARPPGARLDARPAPHRQRHPSDRRRHGARAGRARHSSLPRFLSSFRCCSPARSTVSRPTTGCSAC